MIILAAPNAFKGSLTADQAAQAMAEGISRVDHDIQVICVPVSDGGDGLIIAMANAIDAQTCTINVRGPRLTHVDANYLFDQSKSTAVIEMALASGLALLSQDLCDPTLTTTLGTGDLIVDALDRGAKHIFMGIGGSATCDGGMGVAAALGYEFLDKQGNPLPPVGDSMIKVEAIDATGIDQRLSDTSFSVACDVINPFCGPDGASFVFCPQKGATPAQVKALDEGLKNLKRVIFKDLGVDLGPVQGAGAAGGLGGGMKAFFNAELCPGIDLVLDVLNFGEKVKTADLVLTAEGQIDNQTCFNKAPAGVAKAAKKAGIPCIGLCGSQGKGIDSLYALGMDAVISICNGPMPLDTAMTEAKHLLSMASEQVVRTYLAGRKSLWDKKK